MAILGVVNERFFNPFCCKNKEVYFACINELLEKSKQLAVLYETDARSTLILYLQNSQISLETEDIGDEISNKRTPQENAAAILRYFRQCGWHSRRLVAVVITLLRLRLIAASWWMR